MKSKIIFICLLVLSFSANLAAKEPVSKEKVVTSRWSFSIGAVDYVNHFLSSQEYSGGPLMRVKVENGAFYKRSENLSWDLDLTFVSTRDSDLGNLPSNPAGTNNVSMTDYVVEYGTSYNWNPISNLYLRAGGSFEVLAGMYMTMPNSVNNSADIAFQPQFKATAGIKYGWTFKNSGIFLYADLGVPFMGLTLVGSHFEAARDIIHLGELLPATFNHLKFSTFHNLQGYNLEVGADFVFNKFTIFMSMDMNHRWWNAYGTQNYKKYELFKIGLGVDLVSRSRVKSNNRYF